MKIPSVKTWIVKTVDGDKFEVLAPTRLLATLNFRHEHGYSYIVENVYVKRQKA